MLPGTFYLTEVDKVHRRFYKIKEADSHDQHLEKSFNWTGALKSNKTSMSRAQKDMLIMDDSEFKETQIQRSLGLNRLNFLDSQFVANATKATQKMD